MAILFSIALAACGGGGGGGGEPVIKTNIQGTILDSNGMPIVAATVTITSPPVTAVTDSLGLFLTQVAPGSHIVAAVTNGVSFFETTISITEGIPSFLGTLYPTIPGGFFRWFLDTDDDGFGVLPDSLYGASDPSTALTSYTLSVLDCDDGNDSIHPGAVEVCGDDTDQDCDGFPRCILLVDDDLGVANGCISPMPDVEHIYVEDLSALSMSYEILRVRCGSPGGLTLSDVSPYALVFWFTGASSENTLTSEDRAALMDYLDNGGRLFLSSQEVLYELYDGQDMEVTDPLFKDYLGVVYVWHDAATMSTLISLPGTPAEGLTLTGCDNDGNGQVDGFPSPVTVQETGTAVWDTSSGLPGSLILTPTASAFVPSVFTGTALPISTLSDDQLAFGTHSMFTATDGNVSPLSSKDWYQWEENFGPNHYLKLRLTGSSYTYQDVTGVNYDPYPDILNPDGGTPSYAQTLFLVPHHYTGFDKAAGFIASGPNWRTVFIAYPYEGLGDDADRREFLSRSVDWLLGQGTP